MEACEGEGEGGRRVGGRDPALIQTLFGMWKQKRRERHRNKNKTYGVGGGGSDADTSDTSLRRRAGHTFL